MKRLKDNSRMKMKKKWQRIVKYHKTNYKKSLPPRFKNRLLAARSKTMTESSSGSI